MTSYNELCEIYFEWEPHQEEINRIFRAIPASMKQAIIEHLNPPSADAVLPTFVMQTPTGYIDLYRCGFDENGDKKWERCADDDCFQLGADGIRRFIIGICMTRPQGMKSSMMYFTFSVESVTLEAVELRIENLASQIKIECSDPNRFSNAAARTIDLLVEFLKSPPETLGGRDPIGFAIPSR